MAVTEQLKIKKTCFCRYFSPAKNSQLITYNNNGKKLKNFITAENKIFAIPAICKKIQ